MSPRSILILLIYLRLGLCSGLFPSGFPTNNLYAFLISSIRATCSVHLIFLYLIILIYLAKSTNHEAPHYAVFYTLSALHPSSVQIIFSATCSQDPSVYVPPLISEIKYNDRRNYFIYRHKPVDPIYIIYYII
jgi:hypothetical protein